MSMAAGGKHAKQIDTETDGAHEEELIRLHLRGIGAEAPE